MQSRGQIMPNVDEHPQKKENLDQFDSFFECITACYGLAGEDIECVTECASVHLQEEPSVES